MTRRIIHIEEGVAKNPVWRMAEPVSFDLFENEHIAIIGPNGGGKTMLAEIIMGNHPLLKQDPVYNFPSNKSPLVSDNIKYISFRDTYGGESDRNYFLQQRWNSTEIDPSLFTKENSGLLENLNEDGIDSLFGDTEDFDAEGLFAQEDSQAQEAAAFCALPPT